MGGYVFLLYRKNQRFSDTTKNILHKFAKANLAGEQRRGM